MTTLPVTRPPRRVAPPVPTGELVLEPPPAIPQPTGARWQQWLSVLPMLAGTVATALMFGGRDGGGPYAYVVGAIFGLSTLGLLVTNWGGGGPRRAELMRARREYLQYLAGLRERVRAIGASQREALIHRHPEPAALWAHVLGPRVWERRAGDADFAVVRVGVGPQSLATALVAPPIEPSAELEPVTAGALRRFLGTHCVLDDLPVALALRSFTRVYLTDAAGGARARALARAVVAQLATFHGPDDVLVVAGVAARHRREWEWLKWLPHALHPSAVDAAGARRLIAAGGAELAELLAGGLTRAGEPTPAHVLVLVDTGEPGPVSAGGPGVTVVHIGHEPPRVLDRTSVVLAIAADGALISSTVDGQIEVGRPDGLAGPDAESLARALAPLRPAGGVGAPAALATDHDLAELLGFGDLVTADLAALWAARAERDLLRVPIGAGPDGSIVELDLKEAAQGGSGPHGLVVGATGSGKSELLRTLVLGLAATHSPTVLNVVLVDFKGGATFASLDRLPHTSAVITNLADALPLVDRMRDALSGELTRRQELLRQAGNLASIRDYERARSGGAPLEPLPTLLLVCDEFTEMLVAKPDFIELFVQIGRIGRSIGVHLLLATQRLEEGRLRGLETNLSYRIALRTFTAHESRMTLGGAGDAAELPASPGHGYLRVGTEPLQRFKAAYVSGPYRAGPHGAPAGTPRIVEYATVPVEPTATSTVEVASAGSLLDVVVDRLAGHGPAAHRVWLPPLAESPTLDALLGPLRADPVRGLSVQDMTLHGGLRVPVAIVDKPFEQRRDVAWFNLAGAAGHVAIVGAPQSGKSQAVRALVLALALTHTPREVQVYGLDFGGGSLGGLVELPHVGGVAGRLDTGPVRRTVGEVATLFADRERRFAARRLDMTALRRLRRPSDLDATLAVPEDGFGDVFLVIDGWATLRHEYEDLEPVVVDIATRGLSYGIHVIAAATRWSDLRPAVQDLFGSRLELRLGDPGDSAISRRGAHNVPAGAPGRGLVGDGLHALTALARTAELDQPALVAAVAAAWAGPGAPAVRMLPAVLPYDALLVTAESGQRIPAGAGLALPIGIAESDLRPVLLEFASEPHLVAFGDSECGKSTLLRGLATTITRRFAPEQARVVVVDYRRSLLGAIESEHLIGYGTAAENTGPLIEAVADYLGRRRPGPDVTPEQLRDRSWWSGPECFVLVDDYDLVATGPANPLLPLLEFLSQARDVGLHLVLTRRAGGAARAQFEPILQRLRELGSPGIVMSGDRDEGALVGSARPGPLPPGRGWLVTRRDGARLVQLALV